LNIGGASLWMSRRADESSCFGSNDHSGVGLNSAKERYQSTERITTGFAQEKCRKKPAATFATTGF